MPNLYKKIPGWFKSESLYKMVVDEFQDGSVFVEVGSYFGRSACYMAEMIKESGKNIEFYCVDKWSWLPPPDRVGVAMVEDLVTEHNRLLSEISNDPLEVFQQCLKNADVLDLVKIIKGDSSESASEFKDMSVDFVYVDAAHDFESANRDISAWINKVKDGGIISGDDFGGDEVERAVRKYFENINLDDMGRDHRYPDSYCTWWTRK